MKRQSNNPKRRVAPQGFLDVEARERLIAGSKYVGSALHKRTPGDYGFRPPVNPRPSKSLCDDLRTIQFEEAKGLLEQGIRRGMISQTFQDDLPKYVWAVDGDGEAYEAKIGNGGYHGYRLSEEQEGGMREIVLREWRARQ